MHRFVVCTYNRADSLVRTLHSLQAQVVRLGGAYPRLGEDGEYFERILAGGTKVMFIGDARVRWRYQTSRNLAERQAFPGERRLFWVPLYMFSQSARAIARFSAPADEAFYREIIAWDFLGSIEGLWRSRRRT